jgi:DNA processing protein
MARWISDDDDDYPEGLFDLADADRPRGFSVEGCFEPATLRVALVGSRKAQPSAVGWAREVARLVVQAGGVVLSGGAVGVDAAAHEAALEARGRTWTVLGCGAPRVTPDENRKLFDAILEGGGAIIRPFPDDTPVHPSRHLKRNGVLAALSTVVVIAQAGVPSGTQNTAHWAAQLGRPLWTTVGPPWLHKEFEGCWYALEACSAKLIQSSEHFVEHVIGRKPLPLPADLTDDEKTVVEALGNDPKHPDELTARTGLPAPAVTSALLTLSLGDVVVEGPAGLYRRKTHVTG